MTNALVQNIDLDKESALNTMLLTNNTNLAQTKDSKEVNFSNLLNSVNAKVEKTQTNFVDKAVKTNTSSINKFALDKKTTKTNSNEKKYISEDKKQLDTTKNVNLTNNKVGKKLQNKEIVSKENLDLNKETKVVNAEIQNTNKIGTKKEDNKNLSDIDNSSFVESSPVFSNKNEDIQIENDNSLLIEQVPTLAITQDIVDEILSSVETNKDLINAIDEIANLANNSDNLSDETKNDIFKALNDLKIKFELDGKTDIQNFKNALQNLSQNIEKIIENQTQELNLNKVKIDLDKLISNEKIEDISEIKKQLENLSEQLEALSNDNKNVQEIKKTFENILENFEKIESENIKTIKVIENNISSLKDLLNDLQKNLKEINSANNVADEIENNLVKDDLKIFFENVKQENEVKLDKNINQDLNKILKIDVEKLSDKKLDKESMNEILDVFSSIDESFELNDKELANDIDKLIQDLKANQEEKFENLDSIVQKIADVQQEIKTYINENEIQDYDIQNQTELDLESNKVSQLLKQDFDFNQENSNLNNNLQDNEILKEDLLQDVDFEINEDLVVKNDNVKIKDVDVNSLEKNLEKALKTQQLIDDMVIDSKVVSISSQSGALSVADEVAKLAMEEITPLSSNSNLQGSVLYDSASGSGSLIKNAAQMMRTTQNVQNPNLDFSGNDVLNQITEKLQQLKGGNEQKLTMVLRPNDLGRLSIELTSNNLGLTTNIMAQNEDVRAYIEKNIDALRQQLSDAGVNVNNIQIKTAGQEGSTNYDGNQNFDGNQQQKDDLNQQHNKHDNQNNKERQQTLASMSNYDLHFAKDFSSVLNKSISYSLD